MAQILLIGRGMYMKKVRCRKEFGTWFYKKIEHYDLDAPIYELYREDGTFDNTFGSYNDMKYYIETGIILA